MNEALFGSTRRRSAPDSSAHPPPLARPGPAQPGAPRVLRDQTGSGAPGRTG